MSDLSRLGPILVTGSGGFIGSHLVPKLAALGADVHEIVNRQDCDLRDYHAVRSRMDAAQPRVVVHLAASADGSVNPDDGLDPHENTVRAAANVVNAVRDLGTLIIHAGSYKQYGRQQLPFSESMSPQPKSGYARSKHAAESLILGHARRNGATAIALRIGPVFGPGQDPARLVPRVLRALVDDREPPAHVTSSPWDPTYVADIVEAVVKALDAPNVHARVVNISQGQPSSAADVAQIIGRLLGLNPTHVAKRVVVTNNDGWGCLGDVSLAQSTLHWTARVGIERGMRETIESLLEPDHDVVDDNLVAAEHP